MEAIMEAIMVAMEAIMDHPNHLRLYYKHGTQSITQYGLIVAICPILIPRVIWLRYLESFLGGMFFSSSIYCSPAYWVIMEPCEMFGCSIYLLCYIIFENLLFKY